MLSSKLGMNIMKQPICVAKESNKVQPTTYLTHLHFTRAHLTTSPIYVGPRLVLNLQQPNFGFSHILQFALHHAWTTLLSFACKRLLPIELFLSLVRVASITHDFPEQRPIFTFHHHASRKPHICVTFFS